jgi:DNA repair exonuclease SbcCD ATPase subunit
MTTTACDDQFSAEPEPVHQPYDVAAILRKNIADLEKELQRQREQNAAATERLREQIERVTSEWERAENDVAAARSDLQSFIDSRNELMARAEAAEAELAPLREQKPALYMAFSECGQFIRYWTRDTANLDATMAVNDFTVLEFFARPTPAPAVPEEWREVMAELTADVKAACDAEHPHRDQYPSVMRKYNNDMEIVEKARSLLQSADHSELAIEKVAPDCRACANRGRINGLSQEFYCDSCIYQGRDWRQNHFVDVSKMVDAVNRRCESCAILPCSCK